MAVHPYEKMIIYGERNQRHTRYQCGHCGLRVTGGVIAEQIDQVLHAGSPRIISRSIWMVCPNCDLGSVEIELNGKVTLHPPQLPGPAITGMPPEIDAAYQEARRCLGVAAHNGTEMVCRKILMHVAAEKGASPGQTFVHYIDHLVGLQYVTPPMKPWVDQIRQNGNETVHEIPTPSPDRAESTLLFTAQLLRMVYEMDALSKKYAPPPPPPVPTTP